MNYLCPNCRQVIATPLIGSYSCCSCDRSNVRVDDSVLTFGELGGEDTVREHRRNIEPGKIDARLAFDLRYIEYCVSAYSYLCSPRAAPSVLSLGCGLGFDIPEYIKRGYDAHGLDVINLSQLWRENLGDQAWRCVVSDDGRLPFPDESFDLITCMNVFEHVGTIAPKELVTDKTAESRRSFIRQAVKALKPGGLFVLSCPNRAYPFDAGHTHWYIDGSTEHFAKNGYTLADPFDPRNFLPSVQDIAEICQEISREVPVSLRISTNSYLFGEGSAASSYDRYEERLSDFATKWSAEYGEPIESATKPNIQAFILRTFETQTAGLGGELSLDFKTRGRHEWAARLTRQALHPRFYVEWRNVANGAVEGDILDIVGELDATITLQSRNSSISITLSIDQAGRVNGLSSHGHKVSGAVTRSPLFIPTVKGEWSECRPIPPVRSNWLEVGARLVGLRRQKAR